MNMRKFIVEIVALRKESVDRNLMTTGDVTAPSTSLSARRAWIEISANTAAPLDFSQVALRKESVDRNVDASLLKASKTGSLSARRAWIEIGLTDHSCGLIGGRSPQGERG